MRGTVVTEAWRTMEMCSMDTQLPSDSKNLCEPHSHAHIIRHNYLVHNTELSNFIKYRLKHTVQSGVI